MLNSVLLMTSCTLKPTSGSQGEHHGVDECHWPGDNSPSCEDKHTIQGAKELVFSLLPDRFPSSFQEPYWIVLHDRIVSVISSPALTSETEWAGYPFALLDFTACHQSYSEMNCSYVLALAHAVWHHSSIGQLSLIPK